MDLEQKAKDLAARHGMTPEHLNGIAEDVLTTLQAERDRCVEVLQRARLGEIDGDLRSLINRIKTGT